MPRQKGTITLCYLHTLPGLEQVAWVEVRRRIPSAQFKGDAYARDRYGVALFTILEDVSRLTRLRVAQDVFINVLWIPKLSRGRQDLQQVENELVQRGDLGRAVNLYSRQQRRQIGSYHVVAEKYGRHQYRLRDWSFTVRQAIGRLYPKWTGSQDAADVNIWATILGSQALIGLQMPHGHPALVDSSYPVELAAGLVELTEPAGNDLFLDPLAGDGGLVLAERGAAGEAAAIWAGRGLLQTGQTSLDSTDTIHTWAGGQLPVGAGTVDKIGSILPAGLDDGLILTYVHEAARLLQPAGKLVVFTHEYDRFLNLLRDEPRLQVSSGYSILAAGEWGRLYLIEHS